MPLARWFRGPLRHRIQALRNPSTALEQYLDGPAVKRLIAEHSIGRRDHSVLLWRLIVLNYWLAAFADGRLGRTPLAPQSGAAEIRARSGPQGGVAPRAPPKLANLFLYSRTCRRGSGSHCSIAKVGIPAYRLVVIEYLCHANYVEIAFVGVNAPAATDGAGAREGVVVRAYASLIEARYQTHPDPLERVSCDDLLAGVPRLAWPLGDSARGGEMTPATAALAAAPVDVILDFGAWPARQLLRPAPRHGVWRYHFGDRQLYPLGSGFLREIIDGVPLTGIELVRLGARQDEDVTLMRALFRTIPFPSRQANRFAPVWGTRHFVIQSLWTLQHSCALGVVTAGETASVHPVERTPTVAEFGRWMLGELGRRAFPLFRRVDPPLHWRIAIRRSRTPLYEDASRSALQSFHWIDSPPDRHWADPTIFENDGQIWLFFEEMVDPSRVGHICCGRLTADGELVDSRPVLQQPHHLSFPQIIAADGAIFMLPESAQGGGVDLYRAARFPDEWVLEKRLLDFRCVDSSIFTLQDRGG